MTGAPGAGMLVFPFRTREASDASKPKHAKKYPNEKMPAMLKAKLIASAVKLAAIKAERDSWAKTALAMELAELKKA